MGKLKLQVLIVPIHISTIGSHELDPHLIRRFLHLTDPSKILLTVIEEVCKRYEKLYSGDDKLIIERIQDKDLCDLDPDFEVGDIFQSGELLRVIVSNPLQTHGYTESTPMNLKVSNLVESTPILPPAPILTDDTSVSSRKRNQMFFKTSDHQIPSKMPKLANTSDNGINKKDDKTDQYTSVLNIKKVRSKNDVSMDDSNISLPPPDIADDRHIPVKVDRKSKDDQKVVSGQRITSGMLNVPPHTKIQNADVIDNSSPPLNNKQILSSDSSWSSGGEVSPSPATNTQISEEEVLNKSSRISNSNGNMGSPKKLSPVNNSQFQASQSPSKVKDSLKVLSSHDNLKTQGEKENNSLNMEMTEGIDAARVQADTKSSEIDAEKKYHLEVQEEAPRNNVEMEVENEAVDVTSEKMRDDEENPNNHKETISKEEVLEMFKQGISSHKKSEKKKSDPKIEHLSNAQSTLIKSLQINMVGSGFPSTEDSRRLRKSANSRLTKKIVNEPNVVVEKKKTNSVKPVELSKSHLISDRSDVQDSKSSESRLYSILNKMKNFETKLSSLTIPGKNLPRKVSPISDSEQSYEDDDNIFLPRINLVGNRNNGNTEKRAVKSDNLESEMSENSESKLKSNLGKDKSINSPDSKTKNISKSLTVPNIPKNRNVKNGSKINGSNSISNNISSDESSESDDSDSQSDSDSDSNSDSSNSKDVSIKPRLAASIPSVKRTLKTSNSGKSTKVHNSSKNSRSNSVSSQGSQGYHTPENSNENLKSYPSREITPRKPANSSLEKLIRKPTLTSLDDLAMRGLPEVKDSSSSLYNKNTKAEGNKIQNTKNIGTDDESESESESDSDSSESDSESDDSSDSDKGDSNKFLDMKKLKKNKPKKKSNVFYSLMKDAKNL